MTQEIEIDRANGRPVYRQLIERITSMVRDGRLPPGERLPTERELAQRLGVARGTVKKAYEALARNEVIEATQGRGSFVSQRRGEEAPPRGRKEEALTRIGEIVAALEELKFSYNEMRTLFDLSVKEREERREALHLAVVDCNPEALSVYERQLCFAGPLRIAKFLLHDLSAKGEAERRLRDFKLILTTSTHYGEVLRLAPSLRERVLRVVFSPSQGTIIELAKLTGIARVGVLCESRRFQEIVLEKLSEFGVAASHVDLALASENVSLKEFLQRKGTLIVSPTLASPQGKAAVAAVRDFTERGGRMVVFDYQIERGSLLHIEERIRVLLAKQA